VTVFAYVLIVLGLLWVMMPYLLRDQINWTIRNTSRWVGVHSVTLLYGVALLLFALTRY
jgi:uncharacterized membrane protein YidH (DUF202 family)